MTTEELLEGKVLVIDKPYGWTSFQAVNKVKSVIRRTTGLQKFKIGHAGTLDPLATGLLLVCVGKCTKEIPTLQDGEKIYFEKLIFNQIMICHIIIYLASEKIQIRLVGLQLPATIWNRR